MYLTDSFDMGFDIQHYYSLHQNLTLEDLAKASSRHTLKGLVKVINKVSLSPNRYLFSNFKPPQGFHLQKNSCTSGFCFSVPTYLFIFELLRMGRSITTWTTRGGYVVRTNSTLGHVRKEQVLCKMSAIVQYRGLGDQNWVKLDTRSC